LDTYTGGFGNPHFTNAMKKHSLDKLTKLAHETLGIEALQDTDSAMENFGKILGRSTMLSMFEKPKVKEFIRDLSIRGKKQLAMGLGNMLQDSMRWLKS
jgi:hypothetical protein